MSEEKLSSEQVPPKFAEWLLAMGCHPEDVPPLDKITEMCRGEYYMVWRSLMEHVSPKDKILNKRLQVFNDDVAKCQKKNVFNELDVNMPKELSLWRKQVELKEQVSDVEARLAEERDRLNQLTDKVSSKLAHLNLSKRSLQDAQRRSWLLQQEAAELREMKENLLETKTIADSLCGVDEGQEVESKLDKCLLALLRPAQATTTVNRAGVSLLSIANPVASSSIASINSDNDAEEQISSIVKCRGDAVFRQLFERRTGLCNMAAARADETHDKDKCTPQSVLAETAALHCNLALEAVKNRVHIKQTSKRLAAAINELNNYLSGEACELLVIRCERAHSAARSLSLRSLCSEVRQREGVFATAVEESHGKSATLVHSLDKAILSKRDELKRLIVSTAAVERKTVNVKDSLVATFNSFHENKRIEASQMSLANTQDSISSLRQFYKQRREKRQKKMDLSLDLDVSEGCSYELTDNGSPKFVDELRFYLKKFNLENNRKLVLESGEKTWIFETVESTLNNLHAKWQNADITTSVICPSVGLAHNLARLAHEVARRSELESAVRALEAERKHDLAIDISPTIEEERLTLDKIKKRLNENIQNLQKTEKMLTLGIENLNMWCDNGLRRYISDQRTVDGRTYMEYERAFQENFFLLECDKKRSYRI